MPKYIIADESDEDAPLGVSLDIDFAEHANLRVNGVVIAALSGSGKLILPYVREHNQPKGLEFNNSGEIVTL